MSDQDIKKARRQVTQNEGLIFERSAPGKSSFQLPPLDVPTVDPAAALESSGVRGDIEGFPEVSEMEVVRHFTRLSTWNYGVDTGAYLLGSCTMKYNPKINEVVARLDGIGNAHPCQPLELSQGCLRIMQHLSKCLLEITGMDAITLHPAAGAHGELTGLLLARAYLESKGNPRRRVLIPDSAHGTNPASAFQVGYQTQSIGSNERGTVDLAQLDKAMNEDVAALMLTNPNTLGVFEDQITAISEIVHSRGGLIYMDGANMNALVGVSRPGDFGIDVLHLNLHKTFSTPHGGGGPGAGPVAVKKILEPFLPVPRIVETPDGLLGCDFERPQSVGRVRAFYGNYGMLVRALAYILANGRDGLLQSTEDAVLNSVYVRKGLEGSYELPYSSPTLHECVFSDKRQARKGVRTGDIAKRLIDYGFHPYTVSFPLIVPGAMMIEPTESESKQELDLLIDALQCIAREAEEQPELVLSAPHSTRVGRMDEVQAARKPILRWRPVSGE
ncbi:MAG: aminomethyl-transferring glycine dehydrogenase subunit GcvPB [Acidobacteria bacterium]|nr:aminomethyl-transferring glycine dehydrogenase subunit GcvPB [Acidobacteriota bacterium]